MGPYPHDAEKAEITDENPMGTDGFEFVEFATDKPDDLHQLFTKMGLSAVAKHKSKDITLYRQGDINYLLNAEKDSFGAGFVDIHGPCAASMGFRVVDAQYAYERALKNGATAYEGGGKCVNAPAIVGIGGALLYFIDQYGADENGKVHMVYDDEFEWINEQHESPKGHGFTYIDHLTHNVIRGNMEKWSAFYEKLFNFKMIRYFDIEGKLTGLVSKALTSPCNKIRIPLNESTDDISQIEEYLHDYNGEGIQHIAVGCDDIYTACSDMRKVDMPFMPAPVHAYYAKTPKRVPHQEEDLELAEKLGILIDGDPASGILLQIFSGLVIGPIFFEFIQRKGDEGFGEGNFRALFESIEDDQIKRGVIAEG